MVFEKLNFHIQKNKGQFLSYIIHRVNPKLMKDLNVRPETIKLGDNIGKSSVMLTSAMIFL
jgi:uncharacterized protein (UPF0248 family)